uniref:Uncharacterized protein n=1 Tax=Gouania willdenowi TaxID=441366 RepID=A0A8C5DPA0_GOUWI
MASTAPFSRRHWSSQSLRVTAKELSIVTVRGQNNAIKEQPLPSSLLSGTLSVLKKRWEQQPQSTPSSPAPTPHTSTSPSTGTNHRSVNKHGAPSAVRGVPMGSSTKVYL